MKTMTKKERRKLQLERHYAALVRLASECGIKKADGKKLSVALLKLEREAHAGAEAYCNGQAFRGYDFNNNEKAWGQFAESIEREVQILFITLPPFFYVNGDARGYALKRRAYSMPNHCRNYVTISHEDTKRVRWLLGCFKKDTGEGFTLDFERIISPPKSMVKGEGVPYWRDWQIKNWGVKWNAYEGSIVKKEADAVHCTFLTPWCVPYGVFDRLQKLGFSVDGYAVIEDEVSPTKIGSGGEWHCRIMCKLSA